MGTVRRTKKPAKRRLKSLSDTRRFLADVINGLNRGEIQTDKAGKLGYLVNVLVKIIEGDGLEARVTALEDKFREIDHER